MRELRNLEGFRPRDLSQRQRLLIFYVVGLALVVLFYTAVYNWGMRTLEGRPQPIFRSLQTVTETMTTTGYGADSPWATPAMNLLMVAMQLTGVIIGFVTLRVLVIPLFERAPLNLDDRLSTKDDHVVVGEYDRDSEVLLDELEELDVGYVLIESDEEEAKRLSDDGYQAINGDSEERADLDRASIGKASLLITDAGDRTASMVLTALEANEDLRVVSFTPSTRRKAAFAEIGVDRSVAPHALIGQRLAEKATMPIAVDAQADDDPIAIREILVRRNSPLHGVRLGESPFADHPELTLVVAGPESALDEAAGELTAARIPRGSAQSQVLVAGLGEGGHAALDALPADVPVTTVDQSERTGPDVAGDVTEPETLRAAGIEDAPVLIVPSTTTRPRC